MKKTIIVISFIAIAIASCKPEVKGELGEVPSKMEGIRGTWEVSGFKQQDPNNAIREERDLSEFYVVDGLTPYRLKFNTDSMTFSVTPGPGKNFFGAGGSWAFDNNEYPTKMFLYTPADTIEALLGSAVRPSDNKLEIQFESSCTQADGSKLITSVYTLIFNRAN
jgi:hypothetical protein